MAKFTELLSEYLEGGKSLPSSFDLIEGFEDLFKAYYYDKEIGFETEELFEMKLDMYAKLYVPVYADRIDKLVVAWTNASNPTKVFYEHYNTTINAGKQLAKTTDLPFDDTVAEPNSLVESDAYTNTDERTTTKNETGVNVEEAYKVIDYLNKEVNIVVLRLLNEFSKCFMKVY